MDSLPPEILCDIFLRTVPFPMHLNRLSPSESILSPLRVSHVCRSWREVALSLRELWSYLYIDNTRFSRRKKQKMMVEIFDTWLARTDEGPTNFMIDCELPSDATIQDHECAEYILTVLVENQHRWKEMHFHCFSVKFSPRFPGFILTNMPLLTELDLNLDRSLQSVVNVTSSSRLRRLAIRHNNFDLVSSSRLPHLEQVHLSFLSGRIIFPESDQPILSCLELLRNAPSLHRVTITSQLKASLSHLPLDGERIILAGLRELSVTGGFGSHLPGTVVDTLVLPSLERLVYCSTVGGEKLLPFFQRSAPPLTYLRLQSEDTPEDSLIGILHLLPDLRDLMLDYVRLSDRFFRELTVMDGVDDCASATKQIVCPRLSRLEIFDAFTETPESSEPLRTMAKSRASYLGTFTTIQLFGHGRRLKHTVNAADIDILADDIDLTLGVIFE